MSINSDHASALLRRKYSPDDCGQGVVPAAFLVADGTAYAEPRLRCHRITGSGELGGEIAEGALHLPPVTGATVIVAIDLGPALFGQGQRGLGLLVNAGQERRWFIEPAEQA